MVRDLHTCPSFLSNSDCLDKVCKSDRINMLRVKTINVSFKFAQEMLSNYSVEQVKFGKPDGNIFTCIWINDLDMKCEIYEYNSLIKKKICYVFEKKPGQEVMQHKTGAQSCKSLRRMSKKDGYEIPDLSKDETFKKYWSYENGKFDDGQVAILYYNQKFNAIRNKDCFSYDVNSSFSAAMLKPMPDTRHIRYQDVVRDGEIGFIHNIGYWPEAHSVVNQLNQPWLVVFDGYADIVCPLVDGNEIFGRFVNKYYKQKKMSTGEKKVQAKEMLNYGIGYFQLVNPLLRTTIIYWSNKLIYDHMDENTIYANTDCIVSKVRRDDIQCGNELGQFKNDHTGEFKYINLTCQWNTELPKWRGVPKDDFKDGFDLLLDDLPTMVTRYILNRKTLQFEKQEVDRCQTLSKI